MGKILLYGIVYFFTGIFFGIATHNPIAAQVMTFILLVGIPLGYARLKGRRRLPFGGLYWCGYVSFMESSLADKELFPNIRRIRSIGGLGRKGLSSGKLKIYGDGLHWKSGGWATPTTKMAGTFHLPWTAIGEVDVHTIFGKISALGGGIELELNDDHGVLQGEFLGSRKALADAIEAARRGSRSHSKKLRHTPPSTESKDESK